MAPDLEYKMENILSCATYLTSVVAAREVGRVRCYQGETIELEFSDGPDWKEIFGNLFHQALLFSPRKWDGVEKM